uniref:Uncharacterized protein n=1 Tax=Uncultured archaeon GZfos26G2 TaxID=3386331 RepID=Q64EH0_UNCAG|nr:hypothetical protein GZ11H11_14 [uncultured archaeon GZfos11H11]
MFVRYEDMAISKEGGVKERDGRRERGIYKSSRRE